MAGHYGGMAARQIVGASATVDARDHCTPFTLPSDGVISMADRVITLTTNVVFKPQCTGEAIHGVSTIGPLNYPFYASSIPQTYVIAASTVIAWVLLIMLLITSRTSFTGPALQGFSSGHGIIGGATGGVSSIAGVGSRPWLQKVAAMTVAVGLALATADTFRVARGQYFLGYEDAVKLRDNVLGSTEIKVVRVVSDIFLWLAQVQTLVRLFPRHKEKVLIKWIGFALILCDTVFAILNVSLVQTIHSPGHYEDAIPALLYLFELALGLLYAAWVMYFALTKRRYAFYNSKMKSICLISILSLVSVLTPVVFFVMDVSNNDVAGWGDYIRWVGAAAASVVVWEWVERIEALERDERKDGILGREVFDGDEMFDVMPTQDVIWTGSRRRRNQFRRHGDDNGDSGDDGDDTHSSSLEKGFSTLTSRLRGKRKPPPDHFPLGRKHSSRATTLPPKRSQQAAGREPQPGSISFGALPKPADVALPQASGPLPPAAIASPVSRTDTTSAASTVYVVRYHATNDMVQPLRREVDASGNTAEAVRQMEIQRQRAQQPQPQAQQDQRRDPEKETYEPADGDTATNHDHDRRGSTWYSVANPFKRKRSGLPREVEAATASNAVENPQVDPRVLSPAHNYSRWDFKSRLGVLAAETGEKFRDRNAARRPDQLEDSPVVVIPAPARGSGRVWTPDEHLRNGTSSSGDSAVNTADGTSGSSAALQPATTGSGRETSGSSTLANSSDAPSATNRHHSGALQNGSSPAGSSSPRERATSTTSRSSEVVRPESLTPSRDINVPVVIPPPNRPRTNRSPLATHQESSSGDDE